MPRLLVLVALSSAAVLVACREPQECENVSLVVVLIVDQLRPEQLERYDAAFTGGLRRLLDEGHLFEQAVHEHALTWTSPGHASLATGLHPRRHGIVHNGWAEPVAGGWRWTDAEEDTTERIVGLPELPGVSPRKLRSSSLADWIVRWHPDARIVSLSGKPTSAVLMGGWGAGWVYWFEANAGRFVTSTYYRDADPPWVARFNSQRLPEFLADSVWESSVPPELRPLSRRDTVRYEYDGVHTFFPHRYAEEADPENRNDYYGWFEDVPLLDAATLALVEEAVEALELGQGPAIDYLAVSLSATDRVGHDFGPWSREQLDNLLRLDQLLDDFLQLLDQRVGKDRYVVGLSSDHGVLAIPEYRREMGLPGSRLTRDERISAREAAAAADSLKMSDDERRAFLVEKLERQLFIADVMVEEELLHESAADSFVSLYRNSYLPDRRTGPWVEGGLVVRLREGLLPSRRGTTHGSPYLYDRRVPMIFLGPEVETGTSATPARTVDFAPTLAELLEIRHPDGLDGRALLPASPQ